MMKKIWLALMFLSVATGGYADEASLRKAFEAQYPQMKVNSITKANYGGLYEVFVDGQIIYTDEKLTFLIADGNLIDPKVKRNITKERMDELTKVDFNSLPLDKAVKVVRGNGSKKLVVFSDPDCPFCKRLEKDSLINISDITVYTFLLPLEGLHPDAANKSKAIWCSSDRGKAWMDWMLNGQLTKAAGACETPLASNVDLARKLGINSTPVMIFADGKRIVGAYPKAEIEKAMANSPKK